METEQKQQWQWVKRRVFFPFIFARNTFPDCLSWSVIPPLYIKLHPQSLFIEIHFKERDYFITAPEMPSVQTFGLEKCFRLSAVSAAHLAELETTCHLRLLSSPWQSGANDLEGYTVPLHMGLAACVGLCFVCVCTSAGTYLCTDKCTSLFMSPHLCSGCCGVCVCVCVCIVRLCWCLCVTVWIAAWDLFSSAWRVPVHLGLWSSLLAE